MSLLSTVFGTRRFSSPVRQFASSPVRQFASSPVRQFASSPVRQFASSPVRQFASSPVLTLLICLISVNLNSQGVGSAPAECGNIGVTLAPEEVLPTCSNTSQYYATVLPNLPSRNSGSIKIKANIIVVQRSDGSGNFQDNATDRQFLDEWLYYCNSHLGIWTDDGSNCGVFPRFPDTKVQVVPNYVFIQDDFFWNNDNNPGGWIDYQQPSSVNWYLNTLDAQIRNNPSIPKGINVFLTVDGSVYDGLNAGIFDINYTDSNLDCPNKPERIECNFKFLWSGEWPSRINLSKPSRIHCPNFYLKYQWFQQRDQAAFPFSNTKYWLTEGGGKILAHEFGHNLDLVHKNSCPNLMHGSSQSSIIDEHQVAIIHKALALTNIRQYIDCSETYNGLGVNFLTERVIAQNEKWDINMRVYSDVRVMPGAKLTVTCKLLMPENGVIHVERGGVLDIDGGEITRANTCSNSEYWGRIAVQGNSGLRQANGITPIQTFGQWQGGVIYLHNNAIIEGAIVGISTYKGGESWNSSYWGGKVVSSKASFIDCKKGVEFMNNGSLKNLV
jgi:hypothetical protein